MADYERPSFNSDWWEKVSQYINEHPEEGFSDDDVKQFIKYVVNKYMNEEDSKVTKEDIQQLKEELK